MQHKMLLKNYPFCRFSYLASFWNSLEDHSYVWKGHKIFYYYFTVFLCFESWLFCGNTCFSICCILSLVLLNFSGLKIFCYSNLKSVKCAVEIILLHFMFGIFQLSSRNFVRSRLQWNSLKIPSRDSGEFRSQ